MKIWHRLLTKCPVKWAGHVKRRLRPHRPKKPKTAQTGVLRPRNPRTGIRKIRRNPKTEKISKTKDLWLRQNKREVYCNMKENFLLCKKLWKKRKHLSRVNEQKIVYVTICYYLRKPEFQPPNQYYKSVVTSSSSLLYTPRNNKFHLS